MAIPVRPLPPSLPPWLLSAAKAANSNVEMTAFEYAQRYWAEHAAKRASQVVASGATEAAAVIAVPVAFLGVMGLAGYAYLSDRAYYQNKLFTPCGQEPRRRDANLTFSPLRRMPPELQLYRPRQMPLPLKSQDRATLTGYVRSLGIDTRGRSMPKVLDDMRKASDKSAQIANKQAEILRHQANGDHHLARQAEQELQALRQSLLTMPQAHPLLGHQLQAMASGTGAAPAKPVSADKKLEPVDWQSLAATGDTDRFVAVARQRIRQVSQVVYADIDAGKKPPEVHAWYVDVAQPDLTAIYTSAKDLPMTDAAGEAWHNTRNHLAYFTPYGEMVLQDGNVNEIREFFAPPKEGMADIVGKVMDRYKTRASFETRGLDGIQISTFANPDDWTELLDNLIRNAVEHPQPGRMVHIVIQYDKGVLRVEDNAKGMSPTLLAAFLGGKRTHNGVILEGDAANADDNLGHGYGAGLIQKFADKMGAQAEYVSQEGVGTTVSLTPKQDAIFAPDAMAFVMRGQGDFDQFQYLLERMPADTRVGILRKLSTIMMAVGNDVFPRIQMAVDPDSRRPGEPVPSLNLLKQELGGIIERYLRFFNIVTSGRIMAGYEEVVESCREGVHILMALLRATAPKAAGVPPPSKWDERAAFNALLLKTDTFIAIVRRAVGDRLDRGDYYTVILEWYVTTICPQIERLQAVLDGIYRTDELMPLLLDAQQQLAGLQTIIPMYLKAGQQDTARVLAIPPMTQLSVLLETLQDKFGNRAHISQIDTAGLRVAPGVDFKKWEELLSMLIHSLATHPRQKGGVVRIIADMSTGALVVKADDGLNEYASEWDDIWEKGSELGIVVENERGSNGSLTTLVFPGGFLEPDPFQFVLGARGDVSVLQMSVDDMSDTRRMALLTEMDVIAARIEDQALSQALDYRVVGASKPHLQVLQSAVTRFEILATILIDNLPQQERISRGLNYTTNHLRLLAQNPEGML